MSFKNLKVIKRARAKPLPDIPINFPQFNNLHLELLEVKDKLKKGLPLIPRSKPVLQKPSPSVSKPNVENFQAKDSSKKTEELASPKKEKVLDKENPKNVGKETPKNTEKEVPKTEQVKVAKAKSKKEEDSLVEDLGEESEDVIDSDALGESSETGGKSVEDVADEAKEDNEKEEFDIYAGLTPEERAIKEREEYLWRFRILKKKYGRNVNVNIPEWNDYSDLSMMKTSYERTIRELYLDDTVETYRTYLVGSWIVMEYVCTEYANIDLGGFAIQQIHMMYKYDSLLIELGEKSCERWTTNLPVEVRLIGMILLQAAIFYLGKILTEKMGKSVGELFKGMTGQPPAEENTRKPTENKPPADEGPKMRGPKVKASDIRKKFDQKEPAKNDK